MPASSCKDACYCCCYCTRKECWVLASLVGHPENVVCHKLPWLARLASCRVLWTGEIASLPQCLLPSALQPVFLCHPLTTFPKSAVCSHYHLLPPNKIKARSNSTTNRYENIEMENDTQVHFSDSWHDDSRKKGISLYYSNLRICEAQKLGFEAGHMPMNPWRSMLIRKTRRYRDSDGKSRKYGWYASSSCCIVKMKWFVSLNR